MKRVQNNQGESATLKESGGGWRVRRVVVGGGVKNQVMI